MTCNATCGLQAKSEQAYLLTSILSDGPVPGHCLPGWVLWQPFFPAHVIPITATLAWLDLCTTCTHLKTSCTIVCHHARKWCNFQALQFCPCLCPYLEKPNPAACLLRQQSSRLRASVPSVLTLRKQKRDVVGWIPSILVLMGWCHETEPEKDGSSLEVPLVVFWCLHLMPAK